jgi:hypothetical protein
MATGRLGEKYFGYAEREEALDQAFEAELNTKLSQLALETADFFDGQMSIELDAHAASRLACLLRTMAKNLPSNV